MNNKLYDYKPLKDLFNISTKSIKPYENPNEEYLHYSIPAFDETRNPIVEKGEEIKSNKYYLDRNGILVSKLNPRIMRVWKYLQNERERSRSICSTEFMVYQSNTNNIDLNYYYQYFKSDIFQNELLLLQSGSTGSRMRVTPRNTLNILLPTPTLEEQTKIASILCSVDDAIEKTEVIIKQTEKVKNGLMQQLLTIGIGHSQFKKTEIGEIPAPWTVTKFKELFELKHGYAFKSEYFSDEGNYILLTPGNFHPVGGLKLKGEKEKYYIGDIPKDYLLSKDDLLVVMTDLTQDCNILGSPAFVNEDNKFLHNQRLGKVERLNEAKVIKEFLYILFNSRWYRNYLKSTATGTTVRHTSPNKIYEVKVPLPTIEEQLKIVAVLKSVEEKITVEKEKCSNLRVLKKGLMQDLLTGKVRVKVDETEVVQK